MKSALPENVQPVPVAEEVADRFREDQEFPLHH